MINLCCAFGGRSDEYEVSLESVYGVLSNADREKYNLIRLGITREGAWYYYTGSDDDIRSGQWINDKENLHSAHLSQTYGDRTLYTEAGNFDIDVFFPVMHGTACEDGTLQGALALCGIPFVGCDCAASACSMDKAITKQIVNGINIPQARAVIALRSKINTECDALCDKAEATLGYPVFVKPARTGSSVGVSKAKDRTGLMQALVNAAKYDTKVLIEEYVPGGEFEVAVLGNADAKASCVGEIVPGSEFYDYNNKYADDTASYYIPARLSDELSEKIRTYALQIYEALGCAGLSRVDFFCDGENVVFNEINTLPGFTPISMYPKLWIHQGLSYSALIDELVALAQERA